MTALPIHAVLPELLATLADTDCCVLEAPPGAGKTTCVPLALLSEPWLAGQKILLLEPRRLAARAACARMADLLGESPGEQVGYRVRLASKISARTRIEVVTEGILTRMLQEDPALTDYGLVIFDEFHERSLDGDLGLALALQGRELYGDLRERPLKLLVMSATLDGQAIAQLMHNAPIVQSQGRSHPVTVHYGEPWRADQDLLARVQQCLQQVLAEQAGSLLVFLPGAGEIRRLAERLAGALPADVILAPLYGDLSLEQQRAAIDAPPAGRRKVVLATNIAETSLTLEGIAAVVDAGLCRVPKFDPTSGMTRLHTQRISRASSEQRAGRAGRLGPGSCYRLWSESQQQGLSAYSPAEIEQADLAPLALQLLQWGINDPGELAWLTPPPPGAWAQALTLLQLLKAAECKGGQWLLTSHGEAMAQLPMHPRLAHMLVHACAWQRVAAAAQVAALLSERDPLQQAPSADVGLRLVSQRRDRRAQLAQQFARACQRLTIDAKAISLSSDDETGLFLALAYPDRIAQQRSANGLHYRLANGRTAVLRDTDNLRKHSWLAVASVGGLQQGQDTIYLAAPLNAELLSSELAQYTREETCVGWDDARNRWLAERRHYLGSLVLKSVALPMPQGDEKKQALLGLVRSRGLSLLDWAPAEALRQRLQLVRQYQSGWPDVSDAALLASLDTWLGPYLHDIHSLQDFKQLPTRTLIENLLSWEQQTALAQLLPTHLAVPSGQSIALDYSANPPVLAVKLQEMFGCTDTPRLLNGQLPVMIHLLSPARRPLQITQDLAGFWGGAYQDVKKEMKGRYPRHPWPDDPLAALPTAKTKRALAQKSQ